MYPVPPSVTRTDVTTPPAITTLALRPVPLPVPVKITSGYDPLVYPLPGLPITISSTKAPIVNVDSITRGDTPLSNWMIVPAGISAVKALSNKISVVPAAVVTTEINVLL